MAQIRLSDADRERLGCEEWLAADARSVSMREAIAMQELRDLNNKILFVTPDDWRDALVGDEVAGDDGGPVEGPDGAPLRRPGRKYPYALLVLVWLALHRAGVPVELGSLDFDYDQVGYRPDPEDEQGKESAPDTTSTP